MFPSEVRNTSRSQSQFPGALALAGWGIAAAGGRPADVPGRGRRPDRCGRRAGRTRDRARRRRGGGAHAVAGRRRPPGRAGAGMPVVIASRTGAGMVAAAGRVRRAADPDGGRPRSPLKARLVLALGLARGMDESADCGVVRRRPCRTDAERWREQVAGGVHLRPATGPPPPREMPRQSREGCGRRASARR